MKGQLELKSLPTTLWSTLNVMPRWPQAIIRDKCTISRDLRATLCLDQRCAKTEWGYIFMYMCLFTYTYTHISESWCGKEWKRYKRRHGFSNQMDTGQNNLSSFLSHRPAYEIVYPGPDRGQVIVSRFQIGNREWRNCMAGTTTGGRAFTREEHVTLEVSKRRQVDPKESAGWWHKRRAGDCHLVHRRSLRVTPWPTFVYDLTVTLKQTPLWMFLNVVFLCQL